jgi:uncharacterized protein (DUF433 family)
MTALDEARAAVLKLSPVERRGLLDWLASEPVEVAPGIYSTPGVCGGDPCVGRTRIMVWLLEACRRDGMTEAELLAAYPSLTARDLANAWAYADAHRDEIEQQIRENESAEGE